MTFEFDSLGDVIVIQSPCIMSKIDSRPKRDLGEKNCKTKNVNCEFLF